LKLRWGLPLVVIAVLLAVAPVAEAQTLVKENCSPVTSENGELYLNQRQSTGLFDARVGDMNCENLRPLLPAHDGHRGVGDVVGDLVLLETALGADRRSTYAEPGKGSGVQLQLLDRSTGVVNQLTTGRRGIIWGKLHPSGTKVMWAEMLKTGLETDWWNNMLGTWAIHVADIQDGRLVNERQWSHPTDPGFMESYGWLDDGTVMLATDSGVPRNPWVPDWLTAQLWTMPDTLQGQPTRWSKPFQTKTWCSGASWCSVWFTDNSPYHEFMHLIDGWIYFSVVWEYDLTGTTADRTPPHNGLDLWRARPDGTQRQRVTSMNSTSFHHVGSLAPDNGSIVASVCGNVSCKGDIDAYRITPAATRHEVTP
jgi:hypothetical protein